MSEQLKQEIKADSDRLRGETAVDDKIIGEREKEAAKFKLEAQEGNGSSVGQRARAKLEAEMEKANTAEEKNHANSIIPYLIKRCEEDIGMAEDVLQEHKTWTKCYQYITSKIFEWMDKNNVAKKGHVSLAFEKQVIYEWAEDYYHREEKPVPVKKESSKGTGGKKQATTKQADSTTKNANSTTKKVDTTTEQSRVSTKGTANKQQGQGRADIKSSELSGQISLFDLL